MAEQQVQSGDNTDYDDETASITATGSVHSVEEDVPEGRVEGRVEGRHTARVANLMMLVRVVAGRAIHWRQVAAEMTDEAMATEERHREQVECLELYYEDELGRREVHYRDLENSWRAVDARQEAELRAWERWGTAVARRLQDANGEIAQLRGLVRDLVGLLEPEVVSDDSAISTDEEGTLTESDDEDDDPEGAEP